MIVMSPVRADGRSPSGSYRGALVRVRWHTSSSLERGGIVEGRFRQGARGFLAECHLQINERVEGFREGKERRLYKDLRQRKPGMTPKDKGFQDHGCGHADR